MVPHAAGFADKAIPEKYWHADRAFPLEENPALVDTAARAGRRPAASRSRSTASRTRTFPDGYEFQAAPDLESRLARGQAYLERVLDTRIRVFVPPHNALSKRGLAAVERRRPEPARLVPVVPSVDAAVGRAHARPTGGASRSIARATGRAKADRLVYPHVLRYRNHAEFGCHSLIPGTTFEEL